MGLVVASAVLGLVLGAVAAVLALRGRSQLLVEQAKAQAEAERATLAERSRASEESARELRAQLEGSRGELEQLRRTLTSETDRRATAEEKATRIPALERTLLEREQTNAAQSEELQSSRQQLSRLETQLVEERKAQEAKLALLEDAQRKLSDAFAALSSEALRNNNQSFLELAKTTLEKYQEGAKGDLDKRQQAIDALLKPVKETLGQVDVRLGEIEKARIGAYEALQQQVKTLASTQTQLQLETTRLVNALRMPAVRGRWGEIQLRRVVEIAGMEEHCDFEEQTSVSTDEGQLRPDLVVHLPGNRKIVVDAKAPLKAFLQAIEAPDEDARRALVAEHARLIRAHMDRLSGKSYWQQFQPTPDFVVMFLPGETFFSAAVQNEPTLIEEGVSARVILSSPTTFIALLRAIAYGWQQERVAESAQLVSNLGRELYDRLRVFTEHLGSVGINLKRAVEGYNKAASSFESRLLVTARRFRELGVNAGSEIDSLGIVDHAPRPLAPVLVAKVDDDPADKPTGS